MNVGVLRLLKKFEDRYITHNVIIVTKWHSPSLTVIKKMSASTVANTNPNEREINPMHLSLEQLNNLKTQNEEELQELQRQLEALHNAKSRFMNARNTLDDISTSVLNDVLLVPLNSSLYVPGKIVDPEKV